jgi:hypothetical protein
LKSKRADSAAVAAAQQRIDAVKTRRILADIAKKAWAATTGARQTNAPPQLIRIAELPRFRRRASNARFGASQSPQLRKMPVK